MISPNRPSTASEATVTAPLLSPNTHHPPKKAFNLHPKTFILPILLSVSFLFSSIFPSFDKEVVSVFSFPITSIFLQVAGATIILFLLNLTQFPSKSILVQQSWIFDFYFIQKSLYILPVSIFFTVSVVLSIISPIIVLLRATTIVWIVLFEFLLFKKKPNVFSVFVILGFLIGAFLISFEYANTIPHNGREIVINLSAALSDGLMLASLKRSLIKLNNINSKISIMEITFFKIGQSFLFLLPVTLLLEEVDGFKAIVHFSMYPMLLIMGGVLLTITFQWISVALVNITTITTFGVLMLIKILPEVLFNFALYNSFTFNNVYHIFGVCLMILCTFCFAFGKWRFYQLSEKRTQLLGVTVSIQQSRGKKSFVFSSERAIPVNANTPVLNINKHSVN